VLGKSTKLKAGQSGMCESLRKYGKSRGTPEEGKKEKRGKQNRIFIKANERRHRVER